MKKTKVIALAMAVVMAQPVLLSCTAKKKELIVKEDDPWYESYRFSLETDRLDTELLEGSVVSYSNGKLYHLYSLINIEDYENYRRTLLDTYDEKGNLLNRFSLKNPGDYELNRVLAIRPKDGNKAEAVADLFAKGGFENAVVDIDLETGDVTDPRFLRDKEGKPLEINDGQNSMGVSEIYFAGDYIVPVIYAGITAGSMETHAYSFKGAEYMCELDLTGIPALYRVEEFSFDSEKNTLFVAGYTYSEGPVVLEFDPDSGNRISYEKYSADSNGKANIGDYKAVDTGELCKIDLLGNITEFDMKTREAKTVIDNNWYTPYFSDLAYDDLKLVSCSSEGAVIYTRKETGYSLFFSGIDETVTILKKAGKNPNAGKKIIELAAPIDQSITEYLSDAVYEFNRTDNEYLIRVWSKYKEGITAGRDIPTLNADDEKLYTMIQELSGSEAPDIAIGIQKNYAMRDEVFEDLTGYLDQQVLDQQFANIIDAAKIGNKQYFIPVTLEIEGLVTDTSLIKGGSAGITFEEFDDMISDDLDGFSPYEYAMSEYNNKLDFVLSCIDTKSSIEGSNVSFGTDQFYKAIEYSADHFAEDGLIEKQDFLSFEDEVKRGRGACRYDRLESYLDFIHACKSSDGDYTIIGTPSVDASGPRFRAKETISVTAVSDEKEGAKKFINFLFSGAGYKDSDRAFQDIVTNRDIMANNISLTTELNNTGYQIDSGFSSIMMGSEGYGIVYGFKSASESMEKNFMESLSTISVYYYDDPVITKFIAEEIAPYYAGDRTLDETVKILDDRANKYIKEM